MQVPRTEEGNISVVLRLLKLDVTRCSDAIPGVPGVQSNMCSAILAELASEERGPSRLNMQAGDKTPRT